MFNDIFFLIETWLIQRPLSMVIVFIFRMKDATCSKKGWIKKCKFSTDLLRSRHTSSHLSRIHQKLANSNRYRLNWAQKFNVPIPGGFL